MAKLINNAGVQHYANKMVLAENRKVGSKSLPTALADIDNLIDEMKTHFDAEYGSALDMELNNNENVFSVGTGTNVDKRSEVENSFTDIELSGNSLVNLSATKQLLNQTSTHYSDVYLCESSRLKANTSYRLEYDFECNIDFTFSKCYLGYSISKDSMRIESSIKFNAKKGKNILNFTLTQSELDNAINNNFKYFMVRVFIDSDKKEKTYSTKNVMLLEGDYTNKPIPQYFESMKSVGQDDVNGHKIEILSNNGNLWNGEFEVGSLDVNNGTENDNGTNRKRTSYIEIMPNKQCSFKINDFVQVSETDNYNINIHFYDSNKQAILNNLGKANYYYITNGNIFTFTTPTNAKYIRMRTEDNRTLTPLSLTLTYGTTVIATQGKSNKKEISLNEPLRGLPNGIRDTIEKINGEWKIVRRCVEVTLNGSETSWNRNTDFNGTEVLFFYINTKHSTSLPEGATKSNGNMVHLQCDSFPCYPLKDRVNNKNNNIEGIIYSDSSNPLIQFHINKSKLASEDPTGFKQWLSQNPTKVVYELVTPIIEDISPVTLQCWKNGTISIDEVLPVETTHTVALNKPAQIKRNIEELTVLRKRVQALEDFYDQVALEQSHQLSLINNSIELDYDI